MKIFVLAGLLLLCLFAKACTQPTEHAPYSEALVDITIYEDKLRAMWLGAAIANWTGLTTEAARTDAPFYTDADWQTMQSVPWKEDALIDYVFQDPWLADDDLDIEYVYLHIMDQHGTARLTADQITTGWQTHINEFIWVSNAQARALMDQGVQPPATGMLANNPDALMIDAQLSTEIFGAIAPGMPSIALQLADLPIRTTATGYAAHAAQFHVLLYSLASQIDYDEPKVAQILWLVNEARLYLPDTSKTAGVIDFVIADYLDNEDKDDWERTRDAVYTRYHLQASQNGFVYQGWTESSVNLATGLIALLYGEGDFRRTVQIGTLSGWDSDFWRPEGDDISPHALDASAPLDTAS